LGKGEDLRDFTEQGCRMGGSKNMSDIACLKRSRGRGGSKNGTGLGKALEEGGNPRRPRNAESERLTNKKKDASQLNSVKIGHTWMVWAGGSA